MHDSAHWLEIGTNIDWRFNGINFYGRMDQSSVSIKSILRCFFKVGLSEGSSLESISHNTLLHVLACAAIYLLLAKHLRETHTQPSIRGFVE